MKTKILFILPKTQQGGAETQMLYILRNINKKKYDVFLGLLYKHRQLKQEFETISGVRKVDFAKKNKYDLGVYFRIADFSRDNSIDIIQTFLGNHHSYIPALLTKKTTAVGGIRGTQDKEFSYSTRISEFDVPKQLAKINKFVMISNSHAARILYIAKGFPPNSINVIPNGIDIKYFSSGKKSKIIREFRLKGKVVLGIIARLAEEKNHELILYCFKDVLAKQKNVRLIIVGDGPEKQKLEQLSQKLELGNSVIFTGNRKDVRDILSAIQIFLFPSKSEGWPNVVGEAMAAGVPVVAYPAGDVPEIITNNVNGIITEPNYHSFREKLEMLLEDSSKRKLLSKNARTFAKNHFSIKNMIHAYEHTYDEIMRQKNEQKE